MAVLLALAVGASLTPTPARAEIGRPRHLGYGISAGPHLSVAPGVLSQIGFDWIKIYDTSQLDDFPGARVLFRVDLRGYPNNINAWEREIVSLAVQLAQAHVAAVEIGNEPNLGVEWGNQIPDARKYTDLLCRAYRIFKQADPNVVVVSAGLAPTITTSDGRNITDLDYAQKMLNAGAGNCFDAFGYHPYGFNQPPEADPAQHVLTFRRAERMMQVLWNNGLRDRQMWITEFGWVRNPAEEGLDCKANTLFKDFQWMVVSRNTQAEYTARAYAYADANWPWAGPMFLWNLNWQMYDPDYEQMCSNLRWFSILNHDGTPLPVYSALQVMEKRPPAEYTPVVGAYTQGMTREVEAGCAGITDMGSFSVLNVGYPGHMEVEVEAANGPGRPQVWTSTQSATSSTLVNVLVDAGGVPPGMYLIAVNLRSTGAQRITAAVVQGWLLIHPPVSAECVARYNQTPTP